MYGLSRDLQVIPEQSGKRRVRKPRPTTSALRNGLKPFPTSLSAMSHELFPILPSSLVAHCCYCYPPFTIHDALFFRILDPRHVWTVPRCRDCRVTFRLFSVVGTVPRTVRKEKRRVRGPRPTTQLSSHSRNLLAGIYGVTTII